MFRRKEDTPVSQSNYTAGNEGSGRNEANQRGGGAESPFARKMGPQENATRTAKMPPKAPASTSRFERVSRPTAQTTEKPSPFRSNSRMTAPTATEESVPATSQRSAPVAEEKSYAPAQEAPATRVAPAMPAQPQTLDQILNRQVEEEVDEESSFSEPKRVLTVGQDTLLKGEISTCDRLVVQGTVDAVLTDVHTIEITETGEFRGAATVQNAEISGRFDGDLTVPGHLTIFETGRVTGKVSYGELEVHRGGMISGKIVLNGQDGSDNNTRKRKSSKASDEESKAQMEMDAA